MAEEISLANAGFGEEELQKGASPYSKRRRNEEREILP